MVNKRKRNSILIYIIIFFFGLTSATCNKHKGDCPKGSHNQIEIKNNSSKTINWRLFIPDTIYKINGSPYDKIINNGSTDTYSIRGETCWEEYFKTVNNGYQYFLIFSNDTVQAIGWEKISGTNRGLLKRVKVDIDYLKNNNFTITYP